MTGRPTAEELRGLLDDCLMWIAGSRAELPAREALAGLVAGALRAVYAAVAAVHEAGEYRDAMLVAVMQIEEAHELADSFGSDPCLSRATACLAAARGLAGQNPLPSRRWRLPASATQGGRLPASVGAPRLLDPTRELLMPVVPLDAPPLAPAPNRAPAPRPAPVASLEELDTLLDEAAAISSPTRHARPAAEAPGRVLGIVSASDSLARTAGALVEELGVLGGQRRAAPGKAWGSQARYESRLLARLDALAACGPRVLPSLVKRLEGRPVPDPELVWALVFLHGTLAGDDALDEALRLGVACDLDQTDVLDAVVDAFAQLPTARVDGRLRPWLTHEEGRCRALAVGALGRRRALLPEDLAAAAEDADLRVARAAAHSVGHVHGAVPRPALDRLLGHADPSVARLALAGAASAGYAAAVANARGLVRAHRGDWAEASLVHALCAGRTALDELLEDSAVGGGPGSLEALGWFGHLDAVPYLAGRLDSEDGSVRQSAAIALQRITGLAEPGPGALMEQRLPATSPSVDGEAWRAWWTNAGQRLDRTVRYRHGAPWSAMTNCAELREPRSCHRVRELCLLELRARTRVAAELDLQGFVATQLASLGTLEEELRASQTPRDGWPVGIRV